MAIVAWNGEFVVVEVVLRACVCVFFFSSESSDIPVAVVRTVPYV